MSLVRVTSFILSGTIFACQIVILRNFDVRNRNAEIGPEKRKDSAKIEMVGISDVPVINFLVMSGQDFLG